MASGGEVNVDNLEHSDAVIDRLVKLLGRKGVLQGDDVSNRPWSVFKPNDPCRAKAIVRPTTTEEVSQVIKICAAAGQKIVPIGGGTGLVEGQVAFEDEIQLSLELMNRIEQIDPTDRTATVQAGVTLQKVQEAADAEDLFFPLDLGGRGTATIGGNVSTNAGGNRVVRYGMARDMVLGLEAVLADGTIVSSLNRMIKNNAGYDLKQLFIGTEGTLGVITRLVLRLREKPRSQNTALVAVESFDNLIEFFKEIDAALGGTLSAFEVMWNSFYTFITADDTPHRPPLSGSYPYYILVEALGGDADHDAERFSQALMSTLDKGLLCDAVIAKSEAERTGIWGIRDDVSLFMKIGPTFAFDISLRIGDMEAYIAKVQAGLSAAFDDHRAITFGHIGDGNVHIVVSVGDGAEAARHAVERIVYQNLIPYQGSISAEHGIGLEKRDYLSISRNEAEIALMGKLKSALDPDNLLNPGKVIGGRTFVS
jgi:FAD/FMN-containing dehydrogenase